jgi:hypothetical protein
MYVYHLVKYDALLVPLGYYYFLMMAAIGGQNIQERKN